jgi:hypothetical protein
VDLSSATKPSQFNPGQLSSLVGFIYAGTEGYILEKINLKWRALAELRML